MAKRPLFYLPLLCLFSCFSDNYKREYYDSGAIKSKVQLNSDNIPHGDYEEYYDSGKLKVKALYTNGKVLDTISHFYENGRLKEKGLLKDGRKNGWWKVYDMSGKPIGSEEFIILKDSLVSYKNQIKTLKNGKNNHKESSFFDLNVPDTLILGKNMGSIDYYANLDTNHKRYLLAVVTNQYSDIESRKDTFSEHPNSTRIGIYAHKPGPKMISGEIIEKLLDTVKLSNDSIELTVKEFRKYFEKEVFVKDSAKN